MRQLDRLWQLLRVWEDVVFLHGMRHRLQAKHPKPATMPLAWLVNHGRSIRNVLNAGDFEPSDLEPFLTPDADILKHVGTVYANIPMELGAWMGISRSGFRLSRDLQAVLNATSLRNMRWPDIPWPTGSFAVGLEEPLRDKDGTPFDCLLVNVLPLPEEGKPERKVVVIRLLSKALADAPMEPTKRQRMEKACKDNRWPTLQQEWTTARRQMTGGKTSVFSLIVDPADNEPVTSAVSDLLFKQHGKLCHCGGTHPEWSQASRLAIGLCLYLDSLPEGSPLVTEWKPHSNPILRDLQSCIVHSDKELTGEERRIFLSLGHIDGDRADLPAHFKTGHWRRPPRRKNAVGEDTRTKTVWVTPHLVLRHRASTERQMELDAELEEALRTDESA